MSEVRAIDVRATLEVADLAAALAFWTEVAGFEVVTTMGDPATFALVASGDAELALVEVEAPAIPLGAACYVTIEGFDAFVAATTAAGHPPEGEPQTWPWGLRDVVVRCPGGGPRIAFGERVD